jgi:hypothetical protein
LIIKDYEYFGDIELFDKDVKTDKRMITVTCSSDTATVYYSQYDKFEKLLNQTMKEILYKSICEKKKILSERYEEAQLGRDIFKEPKKLKFLTRSKFNLKLPYYVEHKLSNKNNSDVNRNEKEHFHDVHIGKKDEVNKQDHIFNDKLCLDTVRQIRFKSVKTSAEHSDKKISLNWVNQQEKRIGYLNKDAPKSLNFFKIDELNVCNRFNTHDNLRELPLKKRITIYSRNSKDFSGILHMPKIILNHTRLKSKNYV